MKLTNVERERITDSVLKVQTVRASLEQVKKEKLPKAQEMEDCLEGVDRELRKALGYPRRETQEQNAEGPEKKR